MSDESALRPADAERNTGSPPLAKGLAFFLVGLVGLHFAATFLWNAPTNPIKESVASDVDAYMRPFFEQNWSLFAPNPINSEDELYVRAQVADIQTGNLEITEWRSATQLEWTLVRGNPAPSRASRVSSNLNRRVSSAWRALTDEQQEIVADNYPDMPDWNPLADDLIEAQGGETSSRVARMVRADRVATGYATQFAKAIWGEGVEAVQIELRRTPVPRWDERMEPEPESPSFTTREFGWRPALVDPRQDEDLFANTIEGLRS